MPDICQDTSLCRFALHSTEHRYLSSLELDARQLALDLCMQMDLAVETVVVPDLALLASTACAHTLVSATI